MNELIAERDRKAKLEAARAMIGKLPPLPPYEVVDSEERALKREYDARLCGVGTRNAAYHAERA